MKAELALPEEFIDQIVDRLMERLRPVITGNANCPDGDIILDVQGLSKYLGVKRSWVYKKVSFREIPHFHAGRYPRFRKSQIDKWMESQTVKPISPLVLPKKARENP